MLTPPIIDWDVVEMLNVPIGRQKLGIGNLGQYIPYGHADVPAVFDTTSAVLVDIPGASLNLTLEVKSAILYWFSGDFDGVGGGSVTRIAYTVSAGGFVHAEHNLDFSASDEFATGAFNHATIPLAPGIYTIKCQARRVSGTQTARITNVTLTAFALPVP